MPIRCDSCGELVNLEYREYRHMVTIHKVVGFDGNFILGHKSEREVSDDIDEVVIACPKCATAFTHDQIRAMYYRQGDTVGVIEWPIPGTEHTITVTMKKAGQQPRHVGDELQVEAIIALPSIGGCIIPELEFLGRVTLFGEQLHSLWGLQGRDVRYRVVQKSGLTWESAASKCRDEVTLEIEGFIMILKERERIWNDNKNP